MTVTEQTPIDQARDVRLKTLLSYLAADPGNSRLKVEAAEHALSVGEPAIALHVLGEPDAELDAKALNLAGVARMQLGQFEQAAEGFQQLLSRGVDDASVHFNLSWSLARIGELERATDLLSDSVVEASPEAATLKVQLLQESGEYEPALQLAGKLLDIHPDHAGLNAAVSVLAIDCEDADLARRSALRAGAHPDALASLGTLALAEQQTDEAIAQFDRALDTNPHIARAWIGRGLARLMRKDANAAAADLDRGAELFDDHAGSWIAAGWAHVMAGDLDQAGQRFERALAADNEDAEAHGSLAVVDALQGRSEQAKDRAATALRLDAECISARLVDTLLSAGHGDPEAIQSLLKTLLETPLGDKGETAAQALARRALN